MKFWYVPEVFESNEARELNDGYYAVLLEEDAQALERQISALKAELRECHESFCRFAKMFGAKVSPPTPPSLVE